MTEAEAIEMLTIMRTFNNGSNAKVKAIDMAINALEKQIAKKPKFVDTRFRNHGRHVSDGCSIDKCYECPNCRSHIFHVFVDENYCKSCGQRLNWEDSEV